MLNKTTSEFDNYTIHNLIKPLFYNLRHVRGSPERDSIVCKQTAAVGAADKNNLANVPQSHAVDRVGSLKRSRNGALYVYACATTI